MIGSNRITGIQTQSTPPSVGSFRGILTGSNRMTGIQTQSTPPSVGSFRGILIGCTVFICGEIFGFVIEKGRVFEPSVVCDQMLMKRFVMLKMFLSAVISGMFCMSVMSMLPFTRQKFLNARQTLVNDLQGKGYLTVMLGGFILGIGMALGGTCPGVVFAQLGTGSQNAVYTLLGTLAGALLYGVLEPTLMSLTKPNKPVKYQFLFHVLGSPYHTTAIPVAAILSVIVFTLEIAYPWDTEVKDSESTSMWKASSWPPFFTGFIVGSLEVPLILIVGGLLGASSSYCTVTAQVLVTDKMKQKVPYLVKFKSGLSNWWQVVFVVAAIHGASSSSQLSGTYGTIEGQSVLMSFCGGVLIIVGARLAEGCTSGHGISGMGLLNSLSIVTMMSMFVGGMLSARCIQMLT